jgi:tRNA threonylcarbamoyl adenosine modification protein (Sua5/YciO/YrdC/YwlC family)
MAPPGFSSATLQHLRPPPGSAAALRTLSSSSDSPRCTLAAVASGSTNGSRLGCAAESVEVGFHARDARPLNRTGTISSSSFSAVASEFVPCNVAAAAAGIGNGSCLAGHGVGLGFKARDAREANRAGAVLSSSLSASAAEPGICDVEAAGFGSGSCLRCEVKSVGLGFKARVARGAVRGCLGRLDSSVGVEMDEEAFGVVVPAREGIYSDAVRALGRGHVVAVPTDTLYGLACDASSGEAIQSVYEIKERNLSSPLAVCVADVDVVSAYGETAHLPAGLLNSLLPGAVTLLLPRRESGLLSASLNPGVGSIGIRIPDSDFIRGLSRSFGGALALTSANTSSHASTVKVEEFEHLWPHCAFVFDAGTLPGGRAGSTVVNLTQEGLFKIVRAGSVLQETRETLAKFGLRDSSS